MCGIVGTIGFNTDKYVKIMNDCQIHRGPDDVGSYFDAQSQVCIGMRRLSIMDLQNGHQPMHNEDNTVYIVFNGEIFNAEELKEELIASGHVFYTKNSDTEVLIHLYEQYGTTMLNQLNGMFAFIIWDQKQKKIFAARDYAGNKPLYYARIENKFLFSSELKCINKTCLINETINMDSVSQYLSLQFVQSPNTIFNEINKLPAATYFLYDLFSEQLTIQKYWTPSFERIENRQVNLKTCIRNGFSDAVNRWKISDVPVASSLSGGIDSTAIVAMLRNNTTSQIDTYTLGFLDAQECDEHILARTISKHFDTNHHEILLSVNELLQDLDQMIYSLDEPYAGGLPSWYIYKEMSKNFKVGFSGIGGDELFGNYGKWIRYQNPLSHGVRIAWEILNGETLQNMRKYSKGSIYHKYMTEGLKETIIQNKIRAQLTNNSNIDFVYENMIKKCGECDWKNIIPWIDFQMQLPDEFLHMTDRFSMNFSLEARTPFLDKQFVEMIYSIPTNIRTEKSNLKSLFVDSMRDLLPNEVIGAPKKGFVLPYKSWLDKDLKELVYAFTSEKYLKDQGIFSENLNKRLIEPYYKGRTYYTSLVWTILMFQLWYNKYQEEKKIARRTIENTLYSS